MHSPVSVTSVYPAQTAAQGRAITAGDGAPASFRHSEMHHTLCGNKSVHDQATPEKEAAQCPDVLQERQLRHMLAPCQRLVLIHSRNKNHNSIQVVLAQRLMAFGCTFQKL